MTKVKEIQKSWKKDGYAFVVTSDGKSLLRKVYDWKTGKYAGRYTIDVGADVYSFIWGEVDGIIKGTDVKYEHNYSKKGAKTSVAEIKEEIKKHNIELPKVAVKVPEENDSEEVKHEKFEEIKMWVTLNVPVYLVGPAGSGKNHTLEQVAKELNLDFYFTNSIQQEYKLTGFISPKLSGEDVYVETEFYKAFTKGGLFFLDELDASIPEVLVLLNAAIANGYFEFQGKGRIDAHENFRVVAAGNTFGNGADEQYTGRLTLDQATLDRFAVVEFGYSLKIEMLLAKGNTELVDFVHELRKQAEEKGIRATFSYRCISMITKAEGKIPLEVILKSAVFKGLDKDTMGTLKPFAIGNNKYFSAMCKIS